MGVLSNVTIRAEIAKGNLVKGAADGMISQCAYQFRAGKIFTGGETCQMIDWTAATPLHKAFQIKPGAMVWIRMREEVKLPDDICATWWQTNTLSRKGIMLANMSIVDPGYEGPLACLFVNFGKNSVLIDDETPMAKLLFEQVDKSVTDPASYRTTVQQYVGELHSTALTGASSFLRVGELSAELDVKKQTILKEIADDAPKALRGAFAWAAGGLALLIAATTFIPWIQSAIQPNLRESVTEAVDSRLMERSAPLPAATQTQIDGLKASNREILKQLKALMDKQDAGSQNSGR